MYFTTLIQTNILLYRFHNYMSNKTVETLAYMSTQQEVKDLLCHNVLVNRIANMLNNFLDVRLLFFLTNVL